MNRRTGWPGDLRGSVDPTDWTNLTNPAAQAEVEAIKAGNRGEMEILADFLNMRE